MTLAFSILAFLFLAVLAFMYFYNLQHVKTTRYLVSKITEMKAFTLGIPQEIIDTEDMTKPEEVDEDFGVVEEDFGEEEITDGETKPEG